MNAEHWAVLERAIKALEACEHPHVQPRSCWCNVCGAWNVDGHWFQPHWRDLLVKVLHDES